MVLTNEEPPEDLPPADGNGTKSQIRFIDSSRGKKVLVYDEYIFHVNSRRGQSTYFKCSKKFKGCNASIILKNFNQENCTFESFTVPGREHVNHSPNPGKINRMEQKKNENIVKEMANPEDLKNSKHVCLFCLVSLPLGYLDITNLENVMPSGHILSVPLDDPVKNSQAFDLLCILLNVKWRKCLDSQLFDQKKSLPLCFQCQALYQELIQVHRQIKELEVHMNKRAKLISETIQRTEQSKEKVNAKRTQLEILGLHHFRKKVVGPELNRFSESEGKKPLISGTSQLKLEEAEESGSQEKFYSIKQEVEESNHFSNELFGDEDNSWLEPDSNSATGDDTTKNQGPIGVDPLSSTSASNSRDDVLTKLRNRKRKLATTTTDDYDNNVEDEENDDSGSDANFSAGNSAQEDDDSDFEKKESQKNRRTTRSSSLPVRKKSPSLKNPVRHYPARSATSINTCHICSARIIGHKTFMNHYKEEHPTSRRYDCIYCHKHYTHVSKVLSHQRNKHTGEKPYKCPSCPGAFASPYLLKLHTSTRHSDVIYKCSHCEKEFTSKTEHTNHIVAMHGEVPKDLFYKKSKKPMKTLTCHLCDLELLGSGPLLQHYKEVHPDEKKYSCKFCKRHFPYIRECLTHQRRHTGEKPFKCKDCDKRFANERGLQAHRLYSHTTREKNLQCPHCPKKFAFKGSLNAHINSHLEYVVICKTCGRTLRTESSFFKHNQQFHEGKAECTQPISDPSKEILDQLDVPIPIQFRKKCHVCMTPIPGKALLPKHFAECHPNHPGDYLTCRCGQKFPNYKKVFNHAIRKHPGAERPYQCEQCPFRFLTTTELKNHAKTHIPVEERHKTHICDVCGVGLASANTLAKHRRLHEGNLPRHVCELCGKSYAEIKGLQQHHKTEHLKLLPHKCPFEGCGKAFPLRSVLLKHQNIHTGEKSYRCGVCNKNFHYSGSLSRHMREVHYAQGEKGQTPRKKKKKKEQQLGGGDGGIIGNEGRGHKEEGWGESGGGFFGSHTSAFPLENCRSAQPEIGSHFHNQLFG